MNVFQFCFVRAKFRAHSRFHYFSVSFTDDSDAKAVLKGNLADVKKEVRNKQLYSVSPSVRVMTFFGHGTKMCLQTEITFINVN